MNSRNYMSGRQWLFFCAALLALALVFSGAAIAARDCMRGEIAEGDRYAPCDISFEITRATPVSFALRHFNRASLRLDRIEVERLGGG